MKMLVIGGGGQVGRALVSAAPASAEMRAPSRATCDLTRPATIAAALRERPDVVVNAAAYTAVDAAEDDADAAFAVNRDGPAQLARQCRIAGVPLIHLSTDYVFDGTKAAPYVESDAPHPINVYGRSKLEGEAAVRAAQPQHVILRTSWIFSPHAANFVAAILSRAGRGETLRVAADQCGTPTPAAAIARAILAIAQRIRAGVAVPWGTYHFAGREAVTRLEFAEAILKTAGPPLAGIRPVGIAAADYPSRARRPQNSALDSSLIGQAFAIDPPRWRDDLAAAVTAIRAASAGRQRVATELGSPVADRSKPEGRSP